RAMHKSLGNGVDPADLIRDFGADLVRLWAASSDYHADVRCSKEIFKQLSESYRKIRNTIRILMANLGTAETDFNPDTDMVAYTDLYDIDKWALSRLNGLTKRVLDAYNSYEFHIVYHEINNFCTVDLSKLYVDITKDRVYTEAKDSLARRSAQTAMYIILSSMVRLVAPILAFTADEVWQAMPHVSTDDKRNVLLNDMPGEVISFTEIEEKYNALFDLRDTVMKALELARTAKTIGKSLDAKLTIYAQGETKALLESFGDELSTIFIVSGVTVTDATAPEGAYCNEENTLGVLVETADGEKCDRCWSYSTDGIHDGEGFLCKRCKTILGL
ncbi:MAG: class I tRNA ligase family protein, partial [Oscillospiraceae bacterium]|nr:class I tRNA ligase family protein [Oscillospiraceae bacterium]